MLNLFNTGSHKAGSSLRAAPKLISGVFVDVAALFPWTLSSHANAGLMAALVAIKSERPITLIGDTRDFEHSSAVMEQLVCRHQEMPDALRGLRLIGKDALEASFGSGYKLETVISPYTLPEQRVQTFIPSRLKGMPMTDKAYYQRSLLRPASSQPGLVSA